MLDRVTLVQLPVVLFSLVVVMMLLLVSIRLDVLVA
jgi:hypothetical protein